MNDLNPQKDRAPIWILGTWVVITALMIPVAVQYSQWREFFVTQVGLITAVVGGFCFLRK